jgi:hypothetical protein
MVVKLSGHINGNTTDYLDAPSMDIRCCTDCTDRGFVALTVLIEVFIIFLSSLEVRLYNTFKKVIVIDYGLHICDAV